MNDYQDFFTNQDGDPEGGQTHSGFPDNPAPPPPPPPPPQPTYLYHSDTGGAFYGDPNAPTGQQQPYGYQIPPVPPQKPVTMNRRIYTMAAVIAVLIFLLCLYCIGADMLHGALGGGDAAVSRNVTVELKTQQKPELDPEDENVTADGEYTVRGVAELVRPSIVEVYTFSGTAKRDSELEGTGSGIVISEDGYIITNAHVVEGEAFTVVLDDENEYNAELIGADYKTDLAVLKISASNLTAAILGDSDESYVGENVVAIGNPAGLTNTVTKGIVSAIGRQVRAESTAFTMECIQTDAAISPGNSGGALVNMYGQVIGITSSKYASRYGGEYEGLGFAITINQALPIITDIMENGYVSGRFRIGISFSSSDNIYAQEEFKEMFDEDMPEALSRSIWISEISEDCDIYHSGLKVNDFILSVEGHDISGYDDVLDALDGFAGGDTVHARCARYLGDGEIDYFDIEFKLEEDTSGNY